MRSVTIRCDIGIVTLGPNEVLRITVARAPGSGTPMLAGEIKKSKWFDVLSSPGFRKYPEAIQLESCQFGNNRFANNGVISCDIAGNPSGETSTVRAQIFINRPNKVVIRAMIIRTDPATGGVTFHAINTKGTGITG